MAEKNVSAISTLMTRLKLEPNNPEAHFNLAVAYEEAGNYDGAINEYERALDLNKNYSRVLLHLGFIQVKKKENGKALELWGKAFKAEPKLVNLFKTEPTAAYYKSKIDDVIAIFQRNVGSNPKVAQGHYDLGLVYKYFDKLELALQCFKTATDLNSVMWEAYIQCGETYSALGQTKMAIEQMRYGILANPGNKNPIVHISLADVYMKENMMGYAQQQLNKAIELDPKSVEAYIMLGKLFFRLSNFKMAMKNYQSAIEIDPRNSEAHYQLAKTCEAMYRPDFALVELEKAVSSKPDFGEAYYDWGNLLLQMGEADKAIPKLEYVLKINPNDAYAHYTLGTAYFKIEDYHAAMYHFKASTQINKSDAYTYYNLGICCMKTKDNNGALQAFGKAMELAPTDSSYAYQRYLVNMNIMDFEEAEKDIKKAIKAKPAEVEYRLKLVNLYRRKKQYRDILDELNSFININPKVSSVYSEMGIAYSELGDSTVAKVSFEKALEINPNDVRAIYGKGELLKASGIKLREAKEMFKKALEIDPNFLPALEDLGLMYFEEGDATTGTKYYKTALDNASPEELNGVKMNYAGVLIKYGHAEEGINVFTNIVNERPEDARLRMALAKALKEIERYDDAISQLHIAQELEPENPDYPMELGKLFTELGLIDEARDTYYTIINMYPTHREAQQALTQLMNQSYSAPTIPAMEQDTVSKPQVSSPTLGKNIPILSLNKKEEVKEQNMGMDSMMMPDLDFGDIEPTEEKKEEVKKPSKPIPLSVGNMADVFSDFDTEEDSALDGDLTDDITNEAQPVQEEVVEEPKAEEPADDLLPNFDDFNLDDLEIPVDADISSDNEILGVELPTTEEKVPSAPVPPKPTPRQDDISIFTTDDDIFSDSSSNDDDIFSSKPQAKPKRDRKAITDDIFSTSQDDIFADSSDDDDIFAESKPKKKASSNSIFDDDDDISDDLFGDISTSKKDDIFGESKSKTSYKSEPIKEEHEDNTVYESTDLPELDDFFGFGDMGMASEEPKPVQKEEPKPIKKEEPAPVKPPVKKEAPKAKVENLFEEDILGSMFDEEPKKPVVEAKPVETVAKSKNSSDLLDLDDELDNLFDADLADTEVDEYNQEDISIDDIEEDSATDLRESKQQLSAVIAAQPNDIPSREALIDVCITLKDYKEAYENQKYLLSHAPADYKRYAKIIEIYAKANKKEELPLVEEYMSMTEPDSKYIEEICKKYIEAGDTSLALNECRRCSKAEPNNTDLSLLLGKMYTSAGNHALATLQYQKVIRKSHDITVHILLAEAYERMNNVKGAVKTLTKYLESAPNDTKIWYKFMMIADEETAFANKDKFKEAVAKHPLTSEQIADLKKKYGNKLI